MEFVLIGATPWYTGEATQLLLSMVICPGKMLVTVHSGVTTTTGIILGCLDSGVMRTPGDSGTL
tara:strand:- start:1864 stop:2055 length:192 start_codon:yes stop_codon:yes gene_type:complete